MLTVPDVALRLPPLRCQIKVGLPVPATDMVAVAPFATAWLAGCEVMTGAATTVIGKLDSTVLPLVSFTLSVIVTLPAATGLMVRVDAEISAVTIPVADNDPVT